MEIIDVKDFVEVKEEKKDVKAARDLAEIKYEPEKPVEKALKLSNDELIARAISDMLKQDEF